METRLSSKTREITISDARPTVLIGDRINPTGMEKIARALTTHNLTLIQKEAIAQVQAGAEVIDINVGIVGADESVILPEAVRAITDVVDVPLSFDSSNPKALEAALKVYQGKPLINSVSYQKYSLQTVLPLAKEYGAAVIGLVMDDEGISKHPDKRVDIACRIAERVASMGIPLEDLIIDCLADTVGLDHNAALVTFDTIKKVKSKLSVNLTVGASNSSFGLPDRASINKAFLVIAIAMGVTCAIANVESVREVVLATDLLMGRDAYAMRYTTAYRRRQTGKKD